MEIDLDVVKDDLVVLGARDIKLLTLGQLLWTGRADTSDYLQDSILYDNGKLYRKRGLRVEQGTGIISLSLAYNDFIPIEHVGVGNLLDIQPHEYGLLKLKYGFTKLDLYIPEQLKAYLKVST